MMFIIKQPRGWRFQMGSKEQRWDELNIFYFLSAALLALLGLTSTYIVKKVEYNNLELTSGTTNSMW